jgi:catechol 2,3-dioxygenase-like lactoylglutathione lyase family enzyme
VTVEDRAASLDWYAAALGIEAATVGRIDDHRVADMNEVPGAIIDMAFLPLGAGNVEILDYVKPEPPPGRAFASAASVGVVSAVLAVADTAAVQRRLADFGVETESLGDGFRFRDPDGLTIEVNRKLGHDTLTLVAAAIRVTDADLAGQWYADALGLRVSEQGSSSAVRVLPVGSDQELRLIATGAGPSSAPNHARGMMHVCLSTEAVEEAHADLTARGDHVPFPPLLGGEDDGDFNGYGVLYVRDPDGVQLELMQTPS